MALSTLTMQQATRAGAALSYQSVSATGGFKFPNDGHTVLIVDNPDTTSHNLVFTIVKTVDGLAATRTVAVAAAPVVIGPFPTNLYNAADDLVFCQPNADMASAVAVVSIA